MRKITSILEMGKDGYGVYFPEIPNIFGFGETVEDAKIDAKNVIIFFVENLKKLNRPIPEVLQQEYELNFEFDIKSLLKYINGTVTKTALSKASGINASQLSHYSSGKKTPRQSQRLKILNGIHKIGRELTMM